MVEVLRTAPLPCPGRAPASNRGLRPALLLAACDARTTRCVFSCTAVQLCSTACGSGRRNRSALALLVPGVRADHHDAAVAADDPALTADLLDARLDLHGKLLLLVSVNDATAAEVIRAE